jgi:hypothetical protein
MSLPYYQVTIFLFVLVSARPNPEPLFGLLRDIKPIQNGNHHTLHFTHSDDIGTLEFHYDVKLRENVVSLDVMDDLHTVDCQSYLMKLFFNSSTTLPEIQEGHILVGHHLWGCLDEDGNPTSVLRRVTRVHSLEESQIHMDTESASYGDAFIDANIHFFTNKYPTESIHVQPESELSTEVITYPEHTNNQGFFDFLKKVWNEIQTFARTITNTVKGIYILGKTIVTGDFNFNKKWTLLNISWNYNTNLKKPIVKNIQIDAGVQCEDCIFYAQATITFNLVIVNYQLRQLTVLLEGNSLVTVSGRIMALRVSGQKDLGKIILPPIFLNVGPVPIIVRTTMPISMGYQMEASGTGQLVPAISAQGGFSFGIRIILGNVEYIKKLNWNIDGTLSHETINHDAQLQLYLMPTLVLSVDNIGGPNFGLKPYVEFTLDARYGELDPTCPASISVHFGLIASIGVQINLLKIYQKTFGPFPVYSYKEPIYSTCLIEEEMQEFKEIKKDNASLQLDRILPGTVLTGIWKTVKDHPSCTYVASKVSFQVIDVLNFGDAGGIIDLYGALNAVKPDGTVCITQVMYSISYYADGRCTFTPFGGEFYGLCEGGGHGQLVEFYGKGDPANNWTRFSLQDSFGCYKLTLSTEIDRK